MRPLGFSPSPTCLRNGRVFLPSKSTKASENTSTPKNSMRHNQWLHFVVDEHPFATYFDVNPGLLGFDPPPQMEPRAASIFWQPGRAELRGLEAESGQRGVGRAGGGKGGGVRGGRGVLRGCSIKLNGVNTERSDHKSRI